MMKLTIKTYFPVFFLFTLIFGGALVGLAYILDPLQVYHKSYWVDDIYSPVTARFQNAGLINQKIIREDCCDSVIIGTSFSQNLLGSETAKVMGWKNTLNMGIAGSYPAEHVATLERALRTGKIKHVIWELNTIYAATEVTPYNAEHILLFEPGKFFPAYLYDEKKWNDLRYLASISIFGQFILQVINGRTPDRVYYWYDEVLGRFKNGAALRSESPEMSTKTYQKTLGTQFPAIDASVLDIIPKYPDVEFFLYLPPFSQHYYGRMSQINYQREMDSHIYLVNALKSYRNANVYSFDDWTDVTGDLDNYMDMMHYNADVNINMVKAMAHSRNRLTANNVSSKIHEMTEHINTYVRRHGS